MRHRKSKIKKQHSLIKGLEKLLLKIAALNEVKSIIPAVISPSKNTQELHLTVQYEVEGGIKCKAYGEGVQEVFIVCDNVDKVKEKIGGL
jgi:hypothetical protein